MNLVRSYLFFLVLGYLSGSILYAELSMRLAHRDARTVQPDANPGVASAFLGGGLRCGLPALAGDLLKGYLPIHWALRYCSLLNPLFALVLLGPVLGHAWPLFSRFRGGKAITVSFGILLGLWPLCPAPAAVLAFFYLFYSLIVRISPHSVRTFAAYGSALLLDALLGPPFPVLLGFLGVSAIVCFKHWVDLHCRPERVSVRFFHSSVFHSSNH